MNSMAAMERRVQDRTRALWGSEGAIAKNALDANTDCEILIKRINIVVAHLKDCSICADEIMAILNYE